MKILSGLFLISTLLLPMKTYAQKQREIRYSNNEVVCVDELENIGHLNFFTWSAKQILDGLARSEFLKEKEWKAIEMNPELALHIKAAADLGIQISESLCPINPKSQSYGSYGNDDEVDAARHFIMSAYLSFKVGKKKAKSFMAAHEDSEYEKTNLMDYYNNEQGFNFGESLIKKYDELKIHDARNRPVRTKYFIEDIKAEIVRRHRVNRGTSTDFMVLTSGPSVCAQTKYPNF